MALMGVMRLELEMKVIVQVMVGVLFFTIYSLTIAVIIFFFFFFEKSLLLLSLVHDLTQRPSKSTFLMVMHIYHLVLLVILRGSMLVWQLVVLVMQVLAC